MGVEVLWDDATHQIIRYQFGPVWSWQDFEAATATSTAMAQTVNHPVGIISDFTQGAPPPMGALSKFKSAQEAAPANLVAVAIVGGGLFIQTLVNAFSRIYRALGEQLIVANTVEEARARLQERLND